MNLKGKTAIVTGGAMGIGLATSKRLVNEGCIVTIWDMNEVEMAKAKTELENLGGKIFTYQCDVTDKTRVAQLAEQARIDMNHVDILINNAGYVKGGDFLDQHVENWERTIDVNLNAVIFATHAVLPQMYERNSGHIVNISSAAGIIGVGGLSVYAASKWAIWGLTESLRFETWSHGKKGIKWISIHPSYLAQGLFEGAKLNFLGNLIVPLVKNHDVIAKAIVNDALKRGKLVVRRPRSLRLSIILRGILPDFLFQKMLVMMGVHTSMHGFKGREVK
ncbi:MAG: short-chain dehydrogenase/reductase SDR [Stygiobacter sp.]|nr:MAG: short-chain dehydrogenase/reductase SDR [Stygiobacter sp.]KAF0213346.1 MAG: short-chain dehydrogenase/reductase [Ignavibacteria bacterium]